MWSQFIKSLSNVGVGAISTKAILVEVAVSAPSTGITEVAESQLRAVAKVLEEWGC